MDAAPSMLYYRARGGATPLAEAYFRFLRRLPRRVRGGLLSYADRHFFWVLYEVLVRAFFGCTRDQEVHAQCPRERIASWPSVI